MLPVPSVQIERGHETPIDPSSESFILAASEASAADSHNCTDTTLSRGLGRDPSVRAMTDPPNDAKFMDIRLGPAAATEGPLPC